jgi:hypothetical protein
MVNELIDLEERGWTALSSGEAAAREFYEAVLDREVVMLFPGGTVLSSRTEILRSMGGPPWAWFRIEEPRTLALGNDAGLIAYRAKAQRQGGEVYPALISSVYVRRGREWKLVFHQQTLG